MLNDDRLLTILKHEATNHGATDYKHSVVSLIQRLRAEVEVLRVLLGDAADELEGVYDEMYPAREEYPNDMRRYEREMRLANRIRDALRGEGEK